MGTVTEQQVLLKIGSLLAESLLAFSGRASDMPTTSITKALRTLEWVQWLSGVTGVGMSMGSIMFSIYVFMYWNIAMEIVN